MASLSPVIYREWTSGSLGTMELWLPGEEVPDDHAYHGWPPLCSLPVINSNKLAFCENLKTVSYTQL